MRSLSNLGRRCSVAVVALGGLLPIPIPVDLPAPLGPETSQSSDPPSTPQSAAGTATKVGVSATPTLRNAIVAEINRIRRAHHLHTLKVSGALVRAGTEHARALAVAGLFTHTWPDGKLFPTWIRSFYPSSGFRSWSAGENLLWSAPALTSASAVQQWLDSPIHRYVLLLPRWREVGVGTVHALGAPGAYGGQNVDLAAAEFGTRMK